jgi:hypothetical protein
MTKKLIYLLALICFVQFTSSAKPPACPGSGCDKKTQVVKPAEVKKAVAPSKKTATTVRPLNFYLFNF